MARAHPGSSQLRRPYQASLPSRIKWNGMKLLSFSHLGRHSYGAVNDVGIVDLGARLSHRWPSLSAALRDGAIDELKSRCAGLDADLSGDEIRYLPPILDPGRILCVGLNYKSHIEETGRSVPTYPTLFVRFPDSHVGHGQPMIRPWVSSEFDYEGEMAEDVTYDPALHSAPSRATAAITTAPFAISSGTQASSRPERISGTPAHSVHGWSRRTKFRTLADSP